MAGSSKLTFGLILAVSSVWSVASWGAEANTASSSASAVSSAAKPAKGTIQTAESQATVSARIDQLLAKELSFDKVKDQLAPRTSDEVYLRRVYIDLVGELPSPTELTLFAFDPSPTKRAAVVEKLLGDARFGRNWGRYWRDVIMYRRAEDRALLVSRPAEEVLTARFNANLSWDKIAREFIEAKGNIAEHGETAVIMAQMAEAVDVASEVSRIFMGVQIQCAQCHNHPTDRWKREQFHEFAAFFPRMAVRPVQVNGQQRGFELVSRDFPGFRRPGGGAGDIEHYMPDLKDPAAKGTMMTPVFFATGEKLTSGATDVDRRGSAADWITSTSNPWFAKAFVNRLWAELVGEGFYEPIDDLGPDRKPSAPETVQYLADQFAAHQYDVKWLFRAVMATAAYERESRPRRNADETPFLANGSQRMRSDQVFDVLGSALGVDLVGQQGNYRGGGNFPGALLGARFQFSSTFGFDPSAQRDDVTSTIPQALLLMNGGQINQAMNARNSNTQLGRLVSQTSDDEELVVELYLRCLAREPNRQELSLSLEHVKSSSDRHEAFEDLLWALINRTEFVFRN